MASATVGPVSVTQGGLVITVLVRPAPTPVWGAEDWSVVGGATVHVVSVSAPNQELTALTVKTATPAQIPVLWKSEFWYTECICQMSLVWVGFSYLGEDYICRI